MGSTFKRLGDLIHPVDVRNSDLAVTKLMGVNLSKQMMPSVANIVGTDLSVYKVVKKGQFACKLMSIGRDACLPIALKTDDEPVIISSAYYAFEVNDESVLSSEYLMMCFLRPDFDRELCFRSGSDVRGGVSWEDFCNMSIPFCPIEEQLVIAREYRVVRERIDLLDSISSKTEEILALLFAEFQRSHNDSKEIALSDMCAISSSKRIFADEYVSCGIPFYRGGEISNKRFGQPLKNLLYISEERYLEVRDKYGVPNAGDVLITAVGTIGNSYMVQDEKFYFKDGNIIWLKDFVDDKINYYVYDFLQSSQFGTILEGICIGSTQTALTITALSDVKLHIGNSSEMAEYCERSKNLHMQINAYRREMESLRTLQNLLFGHMLGRG